MEFTDSTILAIAWMNRIVSGRQGLWPQPVWCNFDFWHKIDQGRIRNLKRVEPTDENDGYWEVEREITFYLLRNPVAIITMQGTRMDTYKGVRFSAWAVQRVRYALLSGNLRDGEESEWVDKTLPICSYTGIPMPRDLSA